MRPSPLPFLSFFLHACLLFAARTSKLVNKVFQMQLECLPPSSLVLCSQATPAWLTRFETVSLSLAVLQTGKELRPSSKSGGSCRIAEKGRDEMKLVASSCRLGAEPPNVGQSQRRNGWRTAFSGRAGQLDSHLGDGAKDFLYH